MQKIPSVHVALLHSKTARGLTNVYKKEKQTFTDGSTLKLKAKRPSETPGTIYLMTQRHIIPVRLMLCIRERSFIWARPNVF